MKIDMHLFSLIVALAASVTDGRISSSLSSSSSSSNRRDLQPALVDSKPHYCTVTEDGTQRGVVNWQGIDQCHKCEGGQLYWPCGTDNANLCTGFCTPEAVCDERLRVAAAAAETPTALRVEKDAIFAEKDELEETIKSLLEEKNAAEEQLSSFVEASSDCTAVTSEKEDLEAQVTTVIAEKVVLEDRVTAVNKEKEVLMARVDELVEAERLFIEKQISLDTNTMMVIKALGVEKDAITAEKDEEIADLENEIAVLKASLANTDDPTTAPTTLAATNVDYTYADFYNSIENEPIVDTADSLTSCSSYAGGDCSRTPTYCYSVEILEARQAGLFQEIKMHESDIKMLESDIKMLESEKIPLKQLPGGGPTLDNNIVDCRFSRARFVQPAVEKYDGSCSGPNSCLNLDFYCVSSTVCELSCSGGKSCKGVTMYCADNQVCAIKLCGGDRCVGAKVVYNGMEFGEEQEWKSPPAEKYRESRFSSF